VKGFSISGITQREDKRPRRLWRGTMPAVDVTIRLSTRDITGAIGSPEGREDMGTMSASFSSSSEWWEEVSFRLWSEGLVWRYCCGEVEVVAIGDAGIGVTFVSGRGGGDSDVMVWL
jgi:hypothetical protein